VLVLTAQASLWRIFGRSLNVDIDFDIGTPDGVNGELSARRLSQNIGKKPAKVDLSRDRENDAAERKSCCVEPAPGTLEAIIRALPSLH
jgi:hypothetical protein